MRSWSIRAGAVLVVVVISSFGPTRANASPITFQFNMPAWDELDGPGAAAQFGSNAILDLTMDNGNISHLSQSYTFNNILSASVSVVGGAFVGAWTSADVSFTNDPGTTFLTTNATGTPTLDLLTDASHPFPSPGVFFLNSSFEGLFLSVGNPTVSDVGFQIAGDDGMVGGNPFSADVIGPETCDTHCGFAVEGIIVPTVSTPEPTTITLTALGLGGLVMRRRRRLS